MKIELEIKAGGINYLVLAKANEEYICSVYSVKVYDGEKYIKLVLSADELRDFLEFNEKLLNKSYEEYMAETEGYCQELKLDSMREENA